MPKTRLETTIASPPMSVLVALTAKPSDDFFAEMLLKALGAHFDAGGSTAAGAAVVSRFLAPLHLTPTVVDGSGLSYADRTSPADVISPLSGRDLISRKVRRLVVMGGGYPSYAGENNLAGNPTAAADVAANWPTKVVYSGIEVGNAVFAGSSMDSAQQLSSPVRAAFDAYAGPGNGLTLYDPTAVYHAVRPGDSLLTEVGPGQNVVNASSGANAFTLGGGDQYYLSLTNAGSLDSTLESLLDVLPSGVSPPPPPPPVPGALSPPSISGNASQGQTLTESHGSWSNSPTGYSYQWEDCDSKGNNCSPMAGACSTFSWRSGRSR